MSFRARLGMFVLTRQEQRVIAFIVLALVLGLATKHYRHTRSRAPASPNEQATASPARGAGLEARATRQAGSPRYSPGTRP